MKMIAMVIVLLMLPLTLAFAQINAANLPDTSAIKQAALDFYEGFYSGDVARMERAIHPDINRATPRDLPQTGRTMLTYSTYSSLIENTRAKIGLLADTARHIQVRILAIENDVANAKVISTTFADYIQLVKLDGQWKIVNVISTAGIAGPPRFKDFKSDDERAAILKTALTYLIGITGADAGRLEIAMSPEFSRIALIPIAATGKTSLRRLRYEAMMENALANVGKQDEIYRDNRATILDINDGLAVVRGNLTGGYEFIQMFKSNGEWKILNSISKPDASLTLAQALALIAGDTMPNFTLSVYGGGQFTLSDYRGKNVLLMFPRGWVGNAWCAYCPYQYLELEQLENAAKIEEQNNLKIAFVMPYGSDRIKDWLAKFPTVLQTLETIKNPQPAPAAGTVQADYTAWVNKKFPIKFNAKEDDPHKIIPILVDENRILSRQAKIFTGFWDNISSEQNMASILIIDKNGILRFKYIGQMTEDRPSVEFLLDFIKKM